MNQAVKITLIAISCFVLGMVVVMGYSRYTATQRENALLRTQLLATPQPGAAQPTQTPSVNVLAPVATPTPPAQKGSISGSLGYPGEGIPPLKIYAFKESDHSVYFKLTTTKNQTTFTIADVNPGTYVVVAYPEGTTELAGGYTKAVPCGLSVECKDHSLIPVNVTAGQTSPGVDLKDWYAPAGQFPAEPQ